jgi:hypothetical protein
MPIFLRAFYVASCGCPAEGRVMRYARPPYIRFSTFLRSSRVVLGANGINRRDDAAF